MNGPVATIAVQLSIPKPQYDKLAERARVMNVRPSEYARRLFDAAYLARVTHEKGLPAEDLALDAECRAVFALAGEKDADAIAAAIGIPPERALRILKGWGLLAKALTPPPAPMGPLTVDDSVSPEDIAEEAGGTKPLPPPAPSEGDLRTPGQLNPEEIAEIKRLYDAGKSVREIADELQVKKGALEMYISNRRPLFPRRGRPGAR